MRQATTASLCLVLGLLLGLLAPGLEAQDAGESPPSALAALTEGNRLFRNGEVEAAAEAYLAGYSPRAPHPTLVYNLGAACHQLGRLPEAVLWYRRADSLEDPWLEENLWLARRSLGSQVLPAGGWLGTLNRHAAAPRWTAVALAWVSLVLLIAWRRLPVWGFAALFLGCAVLYASAAAIERWGPRPAVLMTDCRTPAGELPAGTEAWVRPRAEGGYRISGTELSCPVESVELVFEAY